MGDGFVSVYKRHTPFSMVQYTQPVTDKITIQPRGDLVSYMYFTKVDSTGKHVQWNWEDILEFEWWIGDRFIDRQDVTYIRYVYPKLMSRTFSKTRFDTAASTFLPLAFSFCTDMPFPIVSLQYQEMYIRITKGQSFDPSSSYTCHINYIHLDESERMYFALNKHSIPIHRVFKVDPRADIQLNCPVKFIATPAVKIPQNFKYSVRVNNQTVRDNEPYTGSEVMFHTEYGDQGVFSNAKFPPRPLTGDTTLITTEYGRGFYSVRASNTAGTNYPWYVSDNTSSYWRSTVYTEQRIIYNATASSNTSNAWRAFAGMNNAWVSADESFGKRVRYTKDMSNISSTPVYGKGESFDFTSNVTSNRDTIGNIFDGNVNTVWTSAAGSYASDLTGTFTINASSTTDATTVLGAFTGQSYWESNSTLGIFTTPGVYASNQYNAFTVSSFYEASNLFGKFTNAYTVNYSSSVGNVILAFNGLTTPWSSNTSVGTYGFSSYAGIYTASGSNNSSNAYLAFDGSSSTAWTSNTVYAKTFGGLYNVSSSSDTSNAYRATDMDATSAWTSNSLFGGYIPGGIYIIAASSNANGYIYQTLASPSNTWVGARLYGNVLPSNTYNISASSNTMNAWTATSNGWTGTQTYGQIRFKAGTYTDSDGVFGRVGSWITGNTYGFSIPAGTYTYSNSSGNALGALLNSNSWYASPSLLNSNIDEFLTLSEIGPHVVTASSNSANAWLAFTPGQTFNFNVDVYKTIAGSLRVTSNSSGLSYNDSFFNKTSNVFISISQNLYAKIPKGTYTFANNFTSQNLHYPFTNQNLQVSCGPLNSDGTFSTGPKRLSIVYPQSLNSSYYTSQPLVKNSWVEANKIDDFTINVYGVTQTNVPVSDIFNSLPNLNIAIRDSFSKFPFGTYTLTPSDAYKLFDNDDNSYYMSDNPTVFIEYPSTPTSSPTIDGVTLNTVEPNVYGINFPMSSQTFSVTNTSFPTTRRYGMISPCEITVTSDGISLLNDCTNFTNPVKGNGFSAQFPPNYSPFIDFKFTGSNVYINRLFILSDIQDLSVGLLDINLSQVTLSFPLRETLDNGMYSVVYSFTELNTNSLRIVFDPRTDNRDTSNIFATVGYNSQPIYMVNFGGVTSCTFSYTRSILINPNLAPQKTRMKFPFTFNTNGTSGITGPTILTYPEMGFVLNAQDTNPSSAIQIIRIADYSYEIYKKNQPLANWNADRVNIGDWLILDRYTSLSRFFRVVNKNTNTLFGNVYDRIVQFRQAYSTTIDDPNNRPLITLDGLPITLLNGVQVWTVPKTGLYRFEVAGAGKSVSAAGAIVYGSYYLSMDEQVEILVGQVSNDNNGGSGGSFVVKNANGTRTPLFIAGGASYTKSATLERITYPGQTPGSGGGGGGGGGYSGNGSDSGSGVSYLDTVNGYISSYAFGGGGIGGGGYSGGTAIGTGGASYDINNNPANGRVTNVGPGYVKVDYIQAQPFIGDDIPDFRILTAPVPILESLNTSNLQMVPAKYSIYDSYTDTLLVSNLFSNTLYTFVNSISTLEYKIVISELYTNTSIPSSNILLSNGTTNGFFGSIYKTLPIVYLNKLQVDNFPYKSFTSGTQVINSSEGYTFTGSVPLQNGYEYAIRITNPNNPRPFTRFRINPPAYLKYTTQPGVNIDTQSELDGTGTYVANTGSVLRIKITKVADNNSYTGELELYNATEKVSTTTTVYTYPPNFIFPKLDIVSATNTSLRMVPNFTSMSGNTAVVNASMIPNSLKQGGYYIGDNIEGGEWLTIDNTNASTFGSIVFGTVSKVTSSGKFVITSTPPDQSVISGNVNFYAGSDKITPVTKPGGPYQGSDPIGGEWIQYTFPRPTRLLTNVVTFSSSEINTYKFLKLNGSIFDTCLPGDSSNTFRLVITSTVQGQSNSCSVSRVSFHKSSTTANVITSGMDAFVSHNTTKALITRMKNYTFGDSTLRGVLPDGYKPYEVQFYGNVYVPYTLTAGQSIIYSSSNLVAAWIGSNADTPTSSNILPGWTRGTNAFVINTTIQGGTYTRIRANVANVTGMFNLSFGSNNGSTIINPISIEAPYYPGGNYNGFGSNCWVQITLPQNTVLGGYYIDSVNANNWTLYGATNPNGLFSSLGSNSLPNSYIRLSPSSYNVYRLEVTSTLYGNLYSNINSILFFDSNNRAIFTGPGTFQNPIPIGNHAIGKYSDSFKVYSNLFNPYSTQFYNLVGNQENDPNIYFSLPSPVNITGIYASDPCRIILDQDTTNVLSGPGFIPITKTINFFRVNSPSLSRLLFINSNGLVIPTSINFNSQTGGNYNGSKVTNGERGEFTELLLPPSNVFKYEIVSSMMPMGWSLHGNVGGTWQLLDKVTNNFSTSYSKYIYSNACSNIRLVISNTFVSYANIVTLNVYTQNFTNVYTSQVLLNDIPESTFVPTVYTASTGTLFNPSTRTWVSNANSNNSSLRLSFATPTRIRRVDVYDTIQTGLQVTEFTNRFNFVSMDDLKTRPINSFKTTENFSDQYSNSFFMQGFMNLYSTSSVTFSFTNPSANCIVWFDKEPNLSDVTARSTGVLSTTLTNQSPGYKKFYLFSNSSLLSQFDITVNVDMISKPTIYYGWFTPTNGQYNFTRSVTMNLIANSVTGTPNIHTVTKTQAAYNSFLLSNASYFDRLDIVLTSETSNLRSVLSNITIYSDNGPINIPGSTGGFSRQPEWIELVVPRGLTINSYSMNTNASNIVLKVGNPLTLVSTQNTKPENGKHVMLPNQTSNIYRFEFYESENRNVFVSDLRLYDTRGLEINPIMASNNFTSVVTDIGEAIRGTYTTIDNQILNTFTSSPTESSTNSGRYYTSNGVYKSELCTLINKPVYGDWIQIELPRPQLVNTFALDITNPVQFPNTIVFCASSDGYNWVEANSCPVTNVNVVDNIHRFPTRLNAPYRFYRMIISNVIPNASGTASFGKLVLLDQNRRRINAFTDAPYATFGGSNNTNENITLTLPQAKPLKYVLITSSTSQYPSNLSINGTLAYPRIVDGKYIYTVSNPTPSVNHRINVNSVNYNTKGSNVSITTMELIDDRGSSIVPILTDNSATYSTVSVPTPYASGVFKCSNVFAFDDNRNTSWVTTKASNIFFEFPERVDVTRYTIVDPFLTSWKIGGVTVNETLTFTNTYSVSISTSNIQFEVLGSNNIVGGLVFYDKTGRLNPTMSSETQYIQNSSIRGGAHVTSNERIIVNLSKAETINSYSISASPFPASWNVYVGTTLVDSRSNFFGNVTNESFVCSLGEFTGSNVSLHITETQPSTSSNVSMTFFQVYDSNGQFLIPKFTSNTTYSTEEYSREVLGYYEYLASSYTDASSAFDSNPNTFYESLVKQSGPLVTQNIIMYYGNTAYANCTDFRSILVASKGRVTDPSASVTYSTTVPSTYGVMDWIQIKLPTSTRITGYRINGTNIITMNMQGSMDGRDFKTFDSRSYTDEVVTVSPQFYKYYRLEVDHVGKFRVYSFDLYNTLGKINSYT